MVSGQRRSAGLPGVSTSASGRWCVGGGQLRAGGLCVAVNSWVQAGASGVALAAFWGSGERGERRPVVGAALWALLGRFCVVVGAVVGGVRGRLAPALLRVVEAVPFCRLSGRPAGRPASRTASTRYRPGAVRVSG